ncbi:MAG: hypothetical protein MUE51_04295 [Thermoleophilia bacterium]|jgi:hypothetical protein|nr:hypothetical protein [Thermoleophilia bacterium]
MVVPVTDHLMTAHQIADRLGIPLADANELVHHDRLPTVLEGLVPERAVEEMAATRDPGVAVYSD